ncbi:MAG: hypothetical protein E6974_08470 [Veillonella sp.]|nr:hypothetical protein [Veillonella sp.]
MHSSYMGLLVVDLNAKPGGASLTRPTVEWRVGRVRRSRHPAFYITRRR